MAYHCPPSAPARPPHGELDSRGHPPHPRSLVSTPLRAYADRLCEAGCRKPRTQRRRENSLIQKDASLHMSGGLRLAYAVNKWGGRHTGGHGQLGHDYGRGQVVRLLVFSGELRRDCFSLDPRVSFPRFPAGRSRLLRQPAARIQSLSTPPAGRPFRFCRTEQAATFTSAAELQSQRLEPSGPFRLPPGFLQARHHGDRPDIAIQRRRV